MKFSFYTPGCSSCDYLKTEGPAPFGQRYCTNFPKKRKKRFRSSDPQYKAPSWCPKRLKPPMVRVYRLTEQAKTQRSVLEDAAGKQEPAPFTPNARKYWLQREFPLSMTAKQFYTATKKGNGLNELYADLLSDDVVELDDGLKPFFFHYSNTRFTPLTLFFKEHVEKRDQPFL